MTITRIAPIIAALLAISSPAVASSDGTPLPNELAGSTQAAGHGMVVFGESTTYLYHLPMWHGVHAWQIVLEVAFDDATLGLYQDDRSAGSALNTFDPEPFPLAKLTPGFVVAGTLYHGHFEQGGKPLGNGTATIKKIVLVTPLQALPETTAPSAPVYRMFGHAGEQYAAHIVTSKPSFDQILKVGGPGVWASAYFSTVDLGKVGP